MILLSAAALDEADEDEICRVEDEMTLLTERWLTVEEQLLLKQQQQQQQHAEAAQRLATDAGLMTLQMDEALGATLVADADANRQTSTRFQSLLQQVQPLVDQLEAFGGGGSGGGDCGSALQTHFESLAAKTQQLRNHAADFDKGIK